MPRSIAPLLLASLALLLPACTKELASNSLLITQPQHAHAPAVDVHNFRGSVDIRVKPHLKDIALSYDVIADGDVKDADAARAAVTVHAEMDDSGELPVLVVRTGSTREADDHAVRLRIDMPACAGVRVINRAGTVTVHNTQGAVQIENHAAPIEVKTSHPLSAPLALSTTDASIYLRVPKTSDALVDAETAGGKVHWESVDPATRLSAFRAGPGRLSVSVNEGGHQVLLRTTSGDIHVSFLENPVARVVFFK